MTRGPAPAGGADYFKASETCVHCGSDSFQAGFGEGTFIPCDCCLDRGAHVGCLERAEGRRLTEEAVLSPGFQFFCSPACESVGRGLVDLQERRVQVGPAGSPFTAELLRYSEVISRDSQRAIDYAIGIFHSSFGPVRLENGHELFTDLCRGYETPDAEAEEADDDDFTSNFCGFRVFVLRNGGSIVSAAAVRVFGPVFAEVPYVATRDGYRREGNCRRLLQALEDMLLGLGVKWMVVPAATRLVKAVWEEKLCFSRLSPEECEVLEARVVMPDGDTAQLVARLVQGSAALATCAAPAAAGGAGRRKPALTLRTRGKAKVSYREAAGSDSGSDSQQSDGSVEEFGGGEDESSEDEEEEGGDASAEEEDGGEGEGEEMEEDGPAEANLHAAAGQAAEGGEAGGAAERSCYNCAITVARQWSDESGQWECGACRRYRVAHANKETRPERLWRRDAARQPNYGQRQQQQQQQQRSRPPAAGQRRAQPKAAKAARPRLPAHLLSGLLRTAGEISGSEAQRLPGAAVLRRLPATLPPAMAACEAACDAAAAPSFQAAPRKLAGEAKPGKPAARLLGQLQLDGSGRGSGGSPTVASAMMSVAQLAFDICE